jgi:protein-disulfide isomerase
MAKKSSRRSPKGSKKVATNKKNNRTIFWIAIGLGVALIIALAAIGYASSQKNKSPAAAAAIDASVGQPVHRTTIGDPNAPVLVETYEDFLCPHCADFTFESGPALLDLVREGKVRWEYKYRVIGGSDSLTANMAAECAADQGEFWEYHEQLFRRIDENGKVAVFPNSLKKLAADLGLDTEQFNQCLDSKQHLGEIQKIDQAAAARGVNGTPTIFINGQRYDGSRSPEAIKAAIEAAAQQ